MSGLIYGFYMLAPAKLEPTYKNLLSFVMKTNQHIAFCYDFGVQIKLLKIFFGSIIMKSFRLLVCFFEKGKG